MRSIFLTLSGKTEPGVSKIKLHTTVNKNNFINAEVNSLHHI